MAERKGWFVLVRKSRENIGDDRIVDEFFTSNGSLRAWVDFDNVCTYSTLLGGLLSFV